MIKTEPQSLLRVTSPRMDNKLPLKASKSQATTNQQADDNPFRRMVGIGIRRQPTEEIMRETRGEDSMR